MHKVATAGLLVLVLIVGTGSSVMAMLPATQPSPPQHRMQSMDHSCCPGLRGATALVQVPPPSLPCGSGHRCCVSSDTPARITSTTWSESGVQPSVRAV